MKKENKKKNNLNSIKDEDMSLKYNEIEIDGFQVFTPNEFMDNKNNNNNLGSVINPFEIKNINDFINSWKTLEELEENKEEKELFDNLWEFILKINKNSIIDYSLINELIGFLSDDILLQRFVFLLFAFLDNSLDDYFKEENNFIVLKNNLIYFMVIVINLKNNEKFNYYLTKEKIVYLTTLISKAQKIKNLENKKICLNILYQLFSNEYIHLGLDIILEEKFENKNNINNIKISEEEENVIIDKENENANNIIYNNNINNQSNYDSESYTILNNFYLSQKAKEIKDNSIQNEKYNKVIDILFNFDSENFLNIKQDNNIDYSVLFFNNINLAQNIILILFSKEKYNFLKNEKEDVYYEFDFLDKVIKKNIAQTKEMHGDKYRNLFRKDSVTNNIIKYIFFIFGNNMLIESIIKPLNTLLNLIGLNNEFEIVSFKGNSLKKERNITKDEFDILFEKVMEKLNDNIPFFFRLFLKMIYDNIINSYPNLEKDDYTPLSSLFFFSYLSNPRIQNIFEIFPEKCLLIKSFFRLLYNTSLNIKFKEDDNLFFFNDEIEKYYKKINEFYENNIINVDVNNEENKKYLKNLFDEMGIAYPEFLFYICCDYIYDLNNDINGKYDQWIKNNIDLINNACYKEEEFNSLIDKIKEDKFSINEQKELYNKIKNIWDNKNLFDTDFLDDGNIKSYKVQRP